MNGVIKDSPLCYKRKVKVNPIARHYENLGEQPYIKYSCPVCDAVGNRPFSITEGTENCPLCGVALNWNRKPEVGDAVVITNAHPDGEDDPQDFPLGAICIITEDHHTDRFYEYPYRLKLEAVSDEDAIYWFYPESAFSILE